LATKRSLKLTHAADLKVVYLPIGDIKPDPNNARTHSAEQVEQLRASMREYGFTNPILLRPNGMIGAGHGRLMAAKANGMATVPTITIHGLSERQWRAYAIADNRLALSAGWSDELLSVQIASLKNEGYDISLLGFADLELGELGIEGFTPDEVTARAEETPEPPKNPVVKRGELWLLGDHRLLCGDSTNADDVAKVLGGGQAASHGH
jgi:ParB-like chromosome segregation protein Spo0J